MPPPVRRMAASRTGKTSQTIRLKLLIRSRCRLLQPSSPHLKGQAHSYPLCIRLFSWSAHIAPPLVDRLLSSESGMSSSPPEPRSGFQTPNFPFQANSQGTSGESWMPGYHFFKKATGDFSQKIGKGQFGKVYKAHLPTGEVIAVKLLHQMSRFDDKQFSHHCAQLMSTNHKNLVRLLGYSYEEHEESHVYNGRAIRGVYKRRLIGFEYVPGGSLANFLSEQHLGWSIRFKIIKEICEGLQYLHEAGIVHFNLNPGNILLDNEKIPKITEFGLWEMFKAVNDGSTITRGCTYSLRYMAPEIYCYGKKSERSDIFSLGALIKSIVAGTTDSGIHHMDGPKCVEHVHKYWRKRLQDIRRYPSFEAHYQQVRTCIGIAVACMHRDPGERPLIKDIVCKLYEVETREDYLSSQVEQGIHDYEVRRISFKELEHVTSNFSQKLGHGGLSAVYKGKLEDGEVIAVKRFDERLRKLEEQFERVVNLTRLKHKNIVRLMGYCYEPTKVPVPDDKNPELYIWWNVIENLLCYEFFPNGSLDMILNDKSCELDWQTSHRIIHGICEGLHHLHVECQDAPLVHEGLKPANVLLDNGMVPKLADFCTSMAVTPRGYIAPEVMDTGKVTVKSNMYSLGVLIIEIATGDRCPSDRSSGRSYIENVWYTTGNLIMLKTLSDKSCELDWQTRHKIICGICEGLYHLHLGCQDAPIVHVGLKPANILPDHGMVQKLGDFCTSMVPTPRGYTAPEVMDTGKVTVKSNIYSLGILIIEIATGDKCPNNEPSGRSYIENVLKTWMQDSYIVSKYPSLEEGFIQQVKSWIIVGLKCAEIQPERRPTIGQIVHFLKTESANSEFYHRGEFTLSLESNIPWPSSEMADHASELAVLESMLSDTHAEPTRLSYSLIKSITRNFSQVIGRGGFGVVYLGFLSNGKVAVKKLSMLQGFSDDKFLDEINCLKKAKHNNIVRFLGYCADSHGELMEFEGRNVIAERPQRLLCFEYVPNGNLQYYIKEKSHGDKWQIRYQLIKGICLGLCYLHKQRINHLDLKPENILLGAEMEPKIADFGLSRFFDEGQSRQFTKNIHGTIGWMAPEIINNGEMSFKSDIYGLGNIIIKLLMTNNNHEFKNWHKSLEVGCSQEKMCVELARRCVEDDQHKRPTIDEIIHELNEMENTIQEEGSTVIQ